MTDDNLSDKLMIKFEYKQENKIRDDIYSTSFQDLSLYIQKLLTANAPSKQYSINNIR